MAAMKTSWITRAGLILLGVLILVWGVLALCTRSAPEKSGPAGVDDRHCANCGRELPAGARTARECPFCQLENGGKAASADRAASSFASSPAVPITLVSLFCLLLGVHAFLFLRTRVAAKPKEVVHYFRCPRCVRKLRYRSHQAGRAAVCPLCRGPVLFPRSQDQPVSRWTRWRRLVTITRR